MEVLPIRRTNVRLGTPATISDETLLTYPDWCLLLTGCLGQEKRQAQRPERIHYIPKREILAKEKPKKIAERRRSGERNEIFGSVNCAMVTPSQNLAESRLKKAVHLTNGPDIYPTVAGLLDQPEVVERRVKDMGSDWASLIWMTNPAGDSQSFIVDFAPGTTLLNVLQEIAQRRSERLTQSTNFTAITSTTKPGMLVTYRQGGDKSELSGTLTAVIRVPVTVREPDDDTLEKFINYQLHATWSLSEKREGAAYTITLSDGARKRVTKINFIGQWVYAELFDALGFMADLSWTFDGKTITFQEIQ